MPLLLVFIFVCVLGLTLIAVVISQNIVEAQRKKQVAGVFNKVAQRPSTEGFNDAPVILADRTDRDDPIRRLLARINLAESLDTLLQQAGLDWKLPQLAFVMLAGGIIGFLAGYKIPVLIFTLPSQIALAALFAALPLLWILHKRRQRFAQFEEQFPEALDFLARAMRSGHAFSVGLEMLGSESPEPLAKEFRTLFHEQNLGAALETALANMAVRVPLLDVRFFVSAVLMQRQTGGNLSEVLDRLAYVIRERFRLKGQVRAASAHGRLTAIILTLLPFATMLGLIIIAPGYLQGMAADQDGKYLIVAAVAGQAVGYLFIRRIVNIEV